MEFNQSKQLLKNESFQYYLHINLENVYAEKEFCEVWSTFEILLGDRRKSFVKSPVKLEEKDAALVHGLASKFLAENIQQENIEDTPQTMLDIAYFFTLVGDNRLGAECLWGAGVLALRNLARNMGKELSSLRSLTCFCADIDTTSNERQKQLFATLTMCHFRGFYENAMKTEHVRTEIEFSKEFIARLKNIDLTPAQNEKIKSTDYNVV